MTVAHNGIVALSKGAYRIVWSGLGNESGAACCASTGDAVIIPSHYDHITIQVIGTFGGSTITLEGSNDGGTTYATLNDSRGEGNAMSFTSADLRKLEEAAGHIRPRIASGCASNVSVIAILRARK